ncbi:hypothetical protein RF11_01904 [Thelohanellus kitauei]|uniref:Uncharacterized protein n=1 Tax=Thelohanellus kitauei TaxID=669202 RepID=A0A0C2JBV8_THEKT|nr:hypothetical protein RF11_01904 [Thelohanellus kitauei]
MSCKVKLRIIVITVNKMNWCLSQKKINYCEKKQSLADKTGCITFAFDDQLHADMNVFDRIFSKIYAEKDSINPCHVRMVEIMTVRLKTPDRTKYDLWSKMSDFLEQVMTKTKLPV